MMDLGKLEYLIKAKNGRFVWVNSANGEEPYFFNSYQDALKIQDKVGGEIVSVKDKGYNLDEDKKLMENPPMALPPEAVNEDDNDLFSDEKGTYRYGFYERECPNCKRLFGIITDNIENDIGNYINHFYPGPEINRPIQDVFPELNPMEREFIKSGYCPECQAEIFGTDYTSDIIKPVSDDGKMYVEESATITESYGETKYEVYSYYGINFTSLEDKLNTNDYSEAENFIWDKLQKGNTVELIDTETGDRKRYSPETHEFGDETFGIEDYLVENKITEATDEDLDEAFYEKICRAFVDTMNLEWVAEDKMNGTVVHGYFEDDDYANKNKDKVNNDNFKDIYYGQYTDEYIEENEPEYYSYQDWEDFYEEYVKDNIKYDMDDIGVFDTVTDKWDFYISEEDMRKLGLWNDDMIKDFLGESEEINETPIVVEFWETEEDREEGLGEIYKYYRLEEKEQAIKDAKHLIDLMSYASVEVFNEETEETYYWTDGVDEEIY